MDAPAAPIYAQTAQTQSDLNNAATNRTNLNNRVNQTNAKGDTTMWTTGPDGRPMQTVTQNATDQGLLAQQQGVQQQAGQLSSGLMGQAQNSMSQPMDTSGLTGWNPNQLDPGFGAVQGVKDDYLNLMKPQQEQEQQRMAATLKNRGIPMGTPAWLNAQRELSDSTARRGWEATDKATSAYGDIFNRSLAANNQANATHQNQYNEMLTTRDQPLKEATTAQGLMGTASDPRFNSYMASGEYKAPDLQKAEADQYQAAMSGYNADQARQSNARSGLMSTVGTVAGAAMMVF